MMDSAELYSDAMAAILRVHQAAKDVLHHWTNSPPPDWKDRPPTDEAICREVRHQIGRALPDVSKDLRTFAQHVLDIHSSGVFRNDLALLYYLLCEKAQIRFCRRIPDPPEPEHHKTLVAAHGYDFLRIYTSKEFEEDVLSRYNLPPDDSDRKEWIRIFGERLEANRAAGKPWVYLPEARYDEIFIEVLTGTWLALFFIGERYDVLWSVVLRTSANETGGLPSGCAVFKAYGDVYREMRESAEEIIFRTGEQSLLNSNCRIRSVVHWPVFFGESVFEPNDDGGPFDLTPPYLRSLGSFYLFWQGLRYVRAGLPITLLLRKERFEKVANDEEQWKLATKWFKLAFGEAKDPCHGPVPNEVRVELEERKILHCWNWKAWYATNHDPKQVHADLLSSRHTVVLAIDDREINKLELQNAACGPRIGAASGGNVVEWKPATASQPADGSTSVQSGELPFSGRRLYGDLLTSYNYAFRLLARQGRDWIASDARDASDRLLAIDVLSRVYALPAPASSTEEDGRDNDPSSLGA